MLMHRRLGLPSCATLLVYCYFTVFSVGVQHSSGADEAIITVSSIPVGGEPIKIFNDRRSKIGQVLARPSLGPSGLNESSSYGIPVESPFRFPWIVHLLDQKSQQGIVFRCDGSLVAPNVVLTAGHCENMTHAYIRASGSKALAGYEVHEVLFDEAHPYYLNHFFPEFDARLLRLKTKSSQSPVRLDNGTGFDRLRNQPVVAVAGYDSELSAEQQQHYQPAADYKYNHHYPEEKAIQSRKQTLSFSNLRWGLVVYLPNEQCYPEYTHVNLITEPMMCAEKVPKFEMYTPFCSGQSGGPLILHEGEGFKFHPWGSPSTDIQIGVMSMGMGCSRFGQPGIYAKVATLHAWIISTISRIS